MPNLPDLPKAEAAIIEQTNAFRAENKLQATHYQATLTKAARDYAKFLAAAPIFSHEADGRRPIDRIKAAGYKPCTSAENLAMISHPRGFETLELVGLMVEAWKNSPGHRKNMLLGPVTETGVGVVKAAGSEKYLGVQLFGRPDTLFYRFAIENRSERAVGYTLNGKTQRLEPRVTVTHGACEPSQIAIEKKAGGIIAKPVAALFEARDGQVYVLSGNKSAEISIEVRDKALGK